MRILTIRPTEMKREERTSSHLPAPRTVIPLSEPEFHGNEWEYVKECLDTGWVSSAGPFVDRFERELAAYVGAKYAIAVVNGTAALHIALKIIGLQPEEEVIVSNLTFVAPVNAILYCQAYPILMDAHPETWQMHPGKVEDFLEKECEVRGEKCFNKKTGRRVKAILPVHILGLACDMERIMEISRRYRLAVVEDAAEALGVRYQGRAAGTFGDVGVFSFNGNKVVTAGGGGMVVTNSLKYADYARYLTTQAKDDPLEYVHREVGYNYRLTNIQAALGVAQLEKIEQFVARKKTIARTYHEALRDISTIKLMPTPPHTEPTYWLYTILLGEPSTLNKRKAILRDLHDRGIGARPLWHTIHDLPPYRSLQAYRIETSIRLYESALSLPSSVGLTDQDQRKCIEVLKQVLVT